MNYLNITFINTSKKKRLAKCDNLLSRYLNDPKIKQMDQYIQHGNTTTLDHAKCVAITCFNLNHLLFLGLEDEKIVETALLHDYYLYDWHIKKKRRKLHGFHHANIACKNAVRDFRIDKDQQHAIRTHMWPLTLRHIPNSKLAILLCASDKYCALCETIKYRVNNKNS